MFASQEYQREISNLHFNDKEVVQGNNLSGNRINRKAVVYSLSILATLKTTSAYKTIFDMQGENNFVAGNAVCVTVTPTQKAFIEHLLQNATHYNDYLIDALERATHFCELDLTKEQLRQDYLLRDFAEKLLQITNPKTLN